ncbi:MAG: hypothetical protein AAGA66_12155 [Bacteroidota bacterium]
MFLKKSKRYPDTPERMALIANFAKLQKIPHYDVKNPTMNKVLVDPYFEVSIRLNEELDVPADSFSYHIGNYQAHGITNKNELVGYLKKEKECLEQNDDRYYLGLRGINGLIHWNRDKLSNSYLLDVEEELRPFLDNFTYKEYLRNINLKRDE